MRHKLSILLLALALVASACVAGDDVTATDGSDTSATSVGTTIPPTSVLRTIPEEATTTTVESTTTVGPDLGPPPEEDWPEIDFDLVQLATMDFPIAMASRSGGDDLWIAERPGRIRQIQRRSSLEGDQQSFRLMNTVVLDISDKVSTDGEGGLLGLAFSLNGQRLYVSYTDNGGDSVIAEYEMGAINAFPETERILLQVDQPFSNHNGGDLSFGPDGFLYIAFGDGGGGGDPENNGQRPENLLGSILRIDPAAQDEGLAYRVPSDNPFASGSLSDGTNGRPETWLWGVRNPWRFSFDSETGDLWIGDVGQSALEEVTVLRNGAEPAGKGANLGWGILEGDSFFFGDEIPAHYVPPIFTYDRSNNRCSITGGHVYRGDIIPELDGVYVFGDYCSGDVFGLDTLDDGRIIVANLRLDRTPSEIVSFGQGPEGELYVMEAGGTVSLVRMPGRGPGTRIVDSDDAQLGGEIDEELQVDQGAGDG